jgi:hypothetical protein
MVELSKEEIEQFLAIDKKRTTAQRTADAEERAAGPLKKKIKEYVEEHGGSDRTTTHYGYLLSLKPRGGTPKWKDEFIAVAGAQAAIEKQAAALPTYTLLVEPAVAAAGQ